MHGGVGAQGEHVAFRVAAGGTAGQEQVFDVQVEQHFVAAAIKQGAVALRFVAVQLALFIQHLDHQPAAIGRTGIEVFADGIAAQAGIDGDFC